MRLLLEVKLGLTLLGGDCMWVSLQMSGNIPTELPLIR